LRNLASGFHRSHLCRLLDTDDSARLAALAVEDGDKAGDTPGQQHPRKIGLRIARADDDNLAVELDVPYAAVAVRVQLGGEAPHHAAPALSASRWAIRDAM
jgi:hypothetical protein